MAYVTTNPPILETQAIAGPKRWSYNSVDAAILVRVSGYFTNGFDLGLRKDDTVIVTDTDAVPPAVTHHVVVSETLQVIDLDDGVAISGADTD